MAEMRAAMPGEPCTAKVVETTEMSAVEVAAEMTAEVSATVATEMSSTVTTAAMSPTVAAASRESAARQHGCQQDNSHSDHRPRHWHPRRAVLFRKP